MSIVQNSLPYAQPAHRLKATDIVAFCHNVLGVPPAFIKQDIMRWLKEDIGLCDVTLSSLGSGSLGNQKMAWFFIIAKQDFVLSSLHLMAAVFYSVMGGSGMHLFSDKEDGTLIKSGDVILAGTGPTGALLMAERTALNLGSRLSGITTYTHHMLNKIRLYDHKVQLLETRKTTPGLRMYEKYATRVGGARNHRLGLNSGIMLKENHIRTFGGIAQALDFLTQHAPVLTQIEVEVETLDQFQQAIVHGAHVVMCDHFSSKMALQAVELRNRMAPHVKVEISGNLDEKNLQHIAQSGVDYMSMGALIHKAIWVDMSMQMC